MTIEGVIEMAILRANFIISPEAKLAIEALRVEYKASWPTDPPTVPCVSWGTIIPKNETAVRSQNVIVSFYQRSQGQNIDKLVQEVSGIKLVFFTTEEFHGQFEGKILDFSNEKGFFLRQP